MQFKEFNNKIQAAATVIYNTEKKVLLLRRGSTAPWQPGKWNLPGGSIDEDESGLQAAKREAKEEINININNAQSLGVVQEKTWSVVFFCCLPNDWTGNPKLSYHNGILENDKFVWELPEDALSYSLVPTVDEAIIKSIKLINNLNESVWGSTPPWHYIYKQHPNEIKCMKCRGKAYLVTPESPSKWPRLYPGVFSKEDHSEVYYLCRRCDSVFTFKNGKIKEVEDAVG